MMLIRGGRVFTGSGLQDADVAIGDGMVLDVGAEPADRSATVIEAAGTPARAYKQWIAGTLVPAGSVTVDDGAVEALFHQGACSDTMETDGRYMLDNNYRYSRRLLEWCQDEEVPFLYASSAAVYGAGRKFSEERAHEAPLNVYAYSKFLFDQVVRRRLPGRTSQIVGLRYFNVYGPNEAHKGRMASVAFHACRQFVTDGRVRLFVGSGGFADGEQRRDFVHVDDVANVNLHFLENPEVSGVYNCGTGRAQSFNDVACATVNAVRRARGEKPLALEELRAAGAIEYIPFPPQLVGKYQSFTQADVAALRAAGYDRPFLPVDEGVGRYVAQRIEAGEGR